MNFPRKHVDLSDEKIYDLLIVGICVCFSIIFAALVFLVLCMVETIRQAIWSRNGGAYEFNDPTEVLVKSDRKKYFTFCKKLKQIATK
uniref:Col_cuticle_N domain-containing protein n=1 Tax=Steinernema glaseri TaxID=37863 RepID=A0A1I7Z981_9BILA